MKVIKIIALLFIIISISSCHKDEDESKMIATTIPTVKIFQEVTGDLIGYVYDENDQPVENALVTVYSGTTTTDKYGIYKFDNIKLDKLGTYIKVEKKGFVFGSDLVYPDKSTVYSYVNLLALSETGTFVAKDGGVIDIEGGGTITFPASDLLKQDGSEYIGKVVVTAKRLAPSDSNIEDKMPGGLRGETTKGASVVLGTLGMIAVELRDDSGNELILKNPVTLSLPVEEAVLSNAPSEIPLWSFDEVRGYWKEEGKALLQDGNYIANLSHFSFWNLDFDFDPIYLCVNVVYENGKPAVGYTVLLTADVIYPTTYGFTDEEGRVCGLVPKGKEMVLEIKSKYCNLTIVSKTIGPFDNDVELDEIVIQDNDNLIKGKVFCNGVAEPEAIVILKRENPQYWNSSFTITDQDGNFSFANYVSCYNTNAIIFAYNPETGEASSSQEIKLGEMNDSLVFDICSSCAFNVEFDMEYGLMCDASTLVLEAKVSKSGTYTYLWSNGETDSEIDGLGYDTYCVTVTETTSGCEIIKCKEIYGGDNLGIDGNPYILHPTCGKNNGSIEGYYVYGGVPPYTYSVDGPGGFTADSVSSLVNLSEGVYNVTISDAAGCSITKTDTLVRDKNHYVSIIAISNGICDSIYLTAQTFNANSSDIVYNWSDGQTGKEINITTSGNYCVTVTEGGDCEISNCEYFEVRHKAEELVKTSCDKNVYTFYSKDDVTVFTQSEEQEYNDESFDFDVLENGYYFDVRSNPEKYCDSEKYEFSVPSLSDGIVIDSTRNTSCETCADGQIFFTINSSNDCYECTYGNYAIFATDDLDTDLRSLNDAGNLVAGQYIVVAFDANTGCFIAHKTVTITEGSECISGSLKDDIILFYSFSNGGIDDKSGFNRDLIKSVQNEPIPTTDRYGNSNCAYMFSFGNEPSFLELRDTSFFGSLEDFTISLWYQPLGTRDLGQLESLFERGDLRADGNLFLGLYDCRKAFISWTTSVWDDENYFGCEEAMTNHDWHHLAATFDAENKELKLYRNGVLQGSMVGEYNTINEGFLRLGNRFNGKLDDVILYGRTLNENEVKDLSNAGSCCD